MYTIRLSNGFDCLFPIEILIFHVPRSKQYILHSFYMYVNAAIPVPVNHILLMELSINIFSSWLPSSQLEAYLHYRGLLGQNVTNKCDELLHVCCCP